MSSYSHRLTICTPVSLLSVANKIAAALDPDVGGSQSFSSVLTTTGQVVCDVWIRETFSVQAQAILSDPSILYQLCLSDYESRWPDLIPPTLEECSKFISDSVILIGPRNSTPLSELLESVGLKLEIPKSSLI